MTAPRMSLRITTQRGAQLAAFAKARGFNHSEAIGALIDHAQKTGLTEPLAFPGVEIGVTNDGTVAITLNHLQLSLTFAQGRSLASSVRRVATTPCSAVLDIDAGTIEIRRIGAAVALRAGDRECAFSRDVARILADQIDNACDHVVSVI